MARYFLHLYYPGIPLPDPEGIKADDDESARRMAIVGIRDILGQEVKSGRLPLDWAIEVENGDTGERQMIPFREAVILTQ